MARAYIKVTCGDKEIRTFGGNNSDVRIMETYYKNISLEEFLLKHTNCTEEDYKKLNVYFGRH